MQTQAGTDDWRPSPGEAGSSQASGQSRAWGDSWSGPDAGGGSGSGSGSGSSAVDTGYDATSLRGGLWWEGSRDGAVLILHDIGVTPEGLADAALAMYYEGFWTAAPLLPGHEGIAATGRLGTLDLAGILATIDRWVAALQAATMPLVVMGCGLGASLAVLVATTYPVQGLITVNLPVRSYHRRRFRSRLAAVATGRACSLDLDAKRSDAKEAQAGFLTSAAYTVARDLERLGAAELASVQAPTLMFQARDDHVVAAGDATAALEGLNSASRELVWLERSFHHAWVDHDAPLIAERSAGFVRALCARPALAAGNPSDASKYVTGEIAVVAAPDSYGTGEWPAMTPEQPQPTSEWDWGGTLT